MAGVLEIFEADANARKEKGRERWHKWNDKRKQTSANVSKRKPTTANDSDALTRGEDNLQDKVISGEEEKKIVSPSARPSRGSRIPDDFQPDIDAAVSEGVPRQEAERQARSFCDYWRSKPGAGGLKLDWPATWRVWYRRNIPAQPPPRNSTSPPSGAEAHMGAVNSILDQIQGKTNAPQHGNQTIDGSYTRSDRSGAPNLVQFDAAAARYRS
jgi:hypothetical protein